MVFLISRGVPSCIFAVLFPGVLLLSLWDLKLWGKNSGFFKLALFCAIRTGAAICGIIVAADNFGNVNVVVAEVVLTQIGSFMIYYTLVGFFQASAKYFNFWQGDTAKLVYTFQRLTLYVLIALAIASGVEGASFSDPSSVAVAVQLAKAYSIIYIVLLSINVIQWGALWFKGNIDRDLFAICCTVALVFVYIKAIYLVVSAWIIDISVRNPFVNAGYYAGLGFTPDFLGALLMAVGGIIAPVERREAARAYANEQEMQQNGGRYNWTAEPPTEQPKPNAGGSFSYIRNEL